MNGMPFGRAIQTTLKLWKKLARFLFFSSGNQSHQLFLSGAGLIQKKAIHRTTAKGTTGLFGSRGSIGHKRKECLKPRPLVNP